MISYYKRQGTAWVAFLSALILSASFSQAETTDLLTHPLVGRKSGIKTNEPPQDAQWEPAWKQLCSYDDFCHRLKNPQDSSWLNPEALQIEILKLYRADILKAAKLYGVDPKAIVGAFLADLTIIPTHEGEIHQFLIDKVRGKNPQAHFPLGLVYPVAALPVEELAAKIEKRNPRKPSEVASLLDTPVGTIYYGAAVIRDAQDRYLQHGYDISQKPDVLATLYNLGKVEAKVVALENRVKKATELKAQGASPEDLAKAGLTLDVLKPRTNFFGLFLNKNAALIDEILDPSKDSVKNKSAPASCATEKSTAIAEFPMIQAINKEFKKTDTGKLSRHVLAINTKLQENIKAGKPIKDEDFAAALKAANEASPLCPSGSKPTFSNPSEFYCSIKKNTNGSDVQATFVTHFIAPENRTPAKIETCYLELATLAGSASARWMSCAQQNLGDLKSSPALTSSAERFSGRETFYGQESLPIATDPESYVAYALPLRCFYSPTASATSSDIRTQQTRLDKALQNNAPSETKGDSSPVTDAAQGAAK